MDADELAFAGIARQAELLRRHEVSSRDLTELCLGRIEDLDQRINAFRTVMPERGLADADRADARLSAGEEAPLLGVPVAVKDNVDMVDEITSHGTAAYGPPATEDAEIVRRLRKTGAVIVGKTTLPELAIHGFTESEAWGATRNPWNLDRVPGGSSGGSAAAVAAGMVGIAHASDGGGSIRIPAASCGIFGLKPQRGRVSMAPSYPEHWHGMSVFGCVSRTVFDTALFLDAVAGPGPGDADAPPPPTRPFAEAAATPPAKLRVALSFKSALPTRLDPEMRAAIEATAELLRSLGHDVVREDVAFGSVGANQATPRYLRGIHDDVVRMPYPERLEARTRHFGQLGGLYPMWLIRRVRSREAAHARRLNRVLERNDVLLMPVLSRPAIEVGRWEGRGALRTIVPMASVYPYTIPWNVTGQPAASVPAGFSRDGLPLAVQLVGRPSDEATLLSLAAQIEAERPWANLRPPTN